VKDGRLAPTRTRPALGSGMIIRHKHTGRYTTVPNAIFEDDRLSIEAKGLLGYLLSRAPNWQARHDQLQHKLGIGRKLLKRCLVEIIEAGYGDRDERQGRDKYHRFTTLNYIIRDISTLPVAGAPKPLRPEPLRPRNTDNNKEAIKTDSNNPFSKSLPIEQGEKQQAQQRDFSVFGKHALASGQHAVYLGSRPYQAWLRVRGEDGMPGFIDWAIINGKTYKLVWMPSLYPPHHFGKEPHESGSDE
jgi:hypothetical protein